MLQRIDRGQSLLPGFLLVAAALTLFMGLWATPLFDLDEGAFTAATLEMFARGDFLTTFLNGQPRYDKPILIYWLQAASVGLFGFHEWSLRLPSALCGLAWMGMAYAFARRLYDKSTAVAAAVLSATVLGVAFITHAATADALLNACLAGALFAQFLYLRDGRSRDRLWMWIAMGLGFLAKGPVAVVLPLATGFIYCATRGEWRRFFALFADWRALLLAALIALPWYVAVTLRDGPGFILGFFFKHNVGRFAGAMEGHGGGPFYYLPVLLILSLPFTGLLATLAAKPRQLWRDDFGRYALILLVLVLALFSFSSTKLPHYLLYGCSMLWVLLARELMLARSRWQVLPALLLFTLLLVFPDLVESSRAQSNAYYQAMLVDLDSHFGLVYRLALGAALGVSLLFLFWTRLALARRLLILGVLASLSLTMLFLPEVGDSLQGPVKRAGLVAAQRPEKLVMDGVNLPSFSVYAGRVVERRAPQVGEVVFTRADRLERLPAHELLHVDKAVALVKIRP